MLKLTTLLVIIPQRDDNDIQSGFKDTILTTQNVTNFEVLNSWDQQTQTAKITISRKNKGWLLLHGFNIDNLTNVDCLDVLKYRNNLLTSKLLTELNKPNENLNRRLFNFDDFNLIGFTDNVLGNHDVNSVIYPIIPVIKVGDVVVFYASYKTNGADSLNKNGKVYLKDNIKLDGVDRSFYRKPYGVENYIREYYLEANSKEEKEKSPRSQLFFGYITAVTTKDNGSVELSCSDYMYYLQALQIKNTTYDPAKFTIEEMFEDLYKDAVERNKKLKDTSNTFYTGNRVKVKPLFKGEVRLIKTDNNKDKNMTAGFIETKMNPTMGMFLKEIKDKYKCQPFFYPSSNILNILPYRITTTPFGTGDYPEFGYQEHIFSFQENIISHNLQFRRKSDKLITVRVKAPLTAEKETTNAQGEKKTKKTQYTILIDPGGDIIDVPFLPNSDTRALLKKKDGIKLYTESMLDWGKRALKKINYDGYYGSFTTFGYPFVRHGDRVLLVDNIYPERQGVYVVKSVKYYGGVGKGFRQDITLDYRIGNYFDSIDKNLL